MPAGNVVYFYVREEEKNPAVFKRKEGEKRMGSKNNGAHTECLVSYLLPCLEQAIPQLPRCVRSSPCSPLCLLPPLQRCLPQRTAGSSRISSAALLHIAPITDYSLLPLLLDLKFGEVEKDHFSLLSSVSNMMLAGSVYCTWHSFSWNKNAFWVLIRRNPAPAISRSKRIID